MPWLVGQSDLRLAPAIRLLSPVNVLAMATVVGLGLGAAFLWRGGLSISSVARVESTGEMAKLEGAAGGAGADVARDTSLPFEEGSQAAPRRIDAPDESVHDRREVAKEPEQAPHDSSISKPVEIFAPPSRLATAELVGPEVAPSEEFEPHVAGDKAAQSAVTARQPGLIAARAAKRKAESSEAVPEPSISEPIAASSVDSASAKPIVAPLPPSRAEAFGTLARSGEIKTAARVVAPPEERPLEAAAEVEERQNEPNGELERASVQGALESIAGLFKGFRE